MSSTDQPTVADPEGPPAPRAALAADLRQAVLNYRHRALDCDQTAEVQEAVAAKARADASWLRGKADELEALLTAAGIPLTTEEKIPEAPVPDAAIVGMPE